MGKAGDSDRFPTALQCLRAVLQLIKEAIFVLVHLIRGGMPIFLKALVHDILKNSRIYVGTSSHQLWFTFKIETLLMDGDGLRQAIDWFGAAAVKICFRHCNVVGKRSDLLALPGGNLVTLTCSDASRFKKLPPKGLEAMQDMLLTMLAKVDHHVAAERLARSTYEDGWPQTRPRPTRWHVASQTPSDPAGLCGERPRGRPQVRLAR